MGPDVRPISRGVGCGMGWGGPESASFKLVYLSGSSCKKKISHKSCENKCFQTGKARDKASYPLESDWSHFHNLSTHLSLPLPERDVWKDRAQPKQPSRRVTSFTHQVLHAAQRAVGTVERVGQLVHAVVGLAVAIETHSDGRAVRKDKVRLN